MVTMVLNEAPVERGDVGVGEHLVQPLLADPAHIVAGIRFAVVENPEIDSRLVQERWRRSG